MTHPRTAQTRTTRNFSLGGAAPADLEQALYDLGIEVTKSDDEEVTGRCPKHVERLGKEDNDPSWSVNRETGMHNCFSCGFSGSFLMLVTELQETDLWSAARWIRGYGVNFEQIENLPDYAARHELREKDRPTVEVTEESLTRFRRPPPEALAVRGITAESARFYGLLWDARETVEMGEHRVAGPAWVIPIRMPDGTLIGWQWKSEKRIGADDWVKNYPKRIRKRYTLFGADVFPVGAVAVPLEAPLDVARLHSAGMEGGLATFGDKFSADQIRLLRDLADEVVWASDNDEAGRAAARRFRDGEPDKNLPAPARRFRATRFLNYGMLPAGSKDIGEPGTADIHILRAVRSAEHALLADLGESPDELHRRIASVPSTRQKTHGQPRASAARDGTGLPHRRQRRYGQPVRRK